MVFAVEQPKTNLAAIDRDSVDPGHLSVRVALVGVAVLLERAYTGLIEPAENWRKGLEYREGRSKPGTVQPCPQNLRCHFRISI
jgi:hypothetical protein